MHWGSDAACFFGAVLLTNAIPHFVNGVMGRRFQSPFATPPGQGLSSATVNVLWGFANLVIGFWLLARIGRFDPATLEPAVAAALGVLLCALMLARLFGRFNGGSTPDGA